MRPAVWLIGIGGLFGYHFSYFTALRLAPPAQASLIAFLWPLLIVLFSGLLPGERLRRAAMSRARCSPSPARRWWWPGPGEACRAGVPARLRSPRPPAR